MPIRIKLKDQDKPIQIRVDADEWSKAYERARGTNGMIEIHEDGRTLAINAGEIVLWELVPDSDPEAESDPDPATEPDPEAEAQFA
jgi:hypothetical protein